MDAFEVDLSRPPPLTKLSGQLYSLLVVSCQALPKAAFPLLTSSGPTAAIPSSRLGNLASIQTIELLENWSAGRPVSPVTPPSSPSPRRSPVNLRLCEPISLSASKPGRLCVVILIPSEPPSDLASCQCRSSARRSVGQSVTGSLNRCFSLFCTSSTLP